ncbi:sodium:solute symporter family protein [Parapedobacter tibetensis]|uniref:sodium:solute symporter family protein n=1 Tax=Parapedobacter tibetensis TaxID=2972951 RepID=UPI00214D7BAF|nr:sodium:solute symporter family protein [Parapedobacter tibetensis]
MMSLQFIDWLLIACYLLFAIGVGFWVKEKAGTSMESYFLADRSLPWWWAGTSIAATTFAADTPLAITGIVAARGLSGNWVWMSWIAVHAAVAIIFARMWRSSGVITDAQFIALRYSGKTASMLRWFRATLYGFVYNAIILGWVLRAMGKIVEPFFHWEEWTPGLVAIVGNFMPGESALGSPSDVLTIFALIAIVTFYASLGGIRGVIFTDLIQFAIGIIGSIWFAVTAWKAVGGKSGIQSGLTSLYGEDHEFLTFFPAAGDGWLQAIGMGAFMFGMYLLVQSYANVPSDGGGFTMQRLSTTKDEKHAKKAALLFIFWQYFVRVWPWFIVAIAALVLIPLGEESAYPLMVKDGTADRELAYSVLMGELLPSGVLGLVIVSLLGAFMSTVDTHFNWGASYVVNDIFLRLHPKATERQKFWAARLAVLGFACMAILVSFQINTIEQAWRWVAFIGAALGIPTALRWLWWRVNATAELASMGFGLITALLVVFFLDIPFEAQLIYTSLASLVGMVVGMTFGKPTNETVLKTFQEQVNPIGVWPINSRKKAVIGLTTALAKVLGLVGSAILVWMLGIKLLFG